MMPTFPSSSLKFRTAGFPQYGFKASVSGETFPSDVRIKPAPGMLVSPLGLSSSFVCFGDPKLRLIRVRGLDPIAHRCSSDHRRSTPGVLARVPVVLSVPSSLIRPHPPHSQAQNDFTAERFIRAAFAVRERLGDPRVVPGFRSLFLLGMSSSKTPENPSVLLCPTIHTEGSGLRPYGKGSAFSTIPTIRARGGSFSGLPVSLPLQPAKLLASLSDPRDVYIRASGGLVTLPAAGYDYSGGWATSTGGTFTHWNSN
jgi:hypothetical protein